MGGAAGKIGMEAAAAGPEEFHRAVLLLGKPGLGVVAVGEAPGDILGEKDPGSELGQGQNHHYHQESRGNELLHQNW